MPISKKRKKKGKTVNGTPPIFGKALEMGETLRDLDRLEKQLKKRQKKENK